MHLRNLEQTIVTLEEENAALRDLQFENAQIQQAKNELERKCLEQEQLIARYEAQQRDQIDFLLQPQGAR